MFTPENGDRDFAENYIIHLTGGARSNDPYSSATEACGLQVEIISLYGSVFFVDKTLICVSTNAVTRLSTVKLGYIESDHRRKVAA